MKILTGRRICNTAYKEKNHQLSHYFFVLKCRGVELAWGGYFMDFHKVEGW